MIKLMRRLKDYKLYVFLTILFVLGQGISELALPTLMSDMVNRGMLTGDTSYILRVGKYMVLLALVCTACAIAGSFFASRVSMGFGRDLRNSVFEKVEHFSMQQFNEYGTASLITRTTNDITQIQNVTVMLLRMGTFTPVMCLGGITLALSKDAKLTLVLAVMVPLMLFFMFLIQRSVLPLFKQMQKKVDRLNMVLRENLTGIRVIRAFNKEEIERERFDDANMDLTQVSIKANKIMAFMMPMMTIMMNGATIAVIWFGGIRVSHGFIEIGDVMAFIQYAMHIMMSFMFIGMIFVFLPRASVSAERISAVIDAEPDGIEDDRISHISDLSDNTNSLTSGNKNIISINNYSESRVCSDANGSDLPAVEFADVSYHYPGSETAALEHISFRAYKGQTTAIIGGTGSGKSTMIQMIPRFFKPTAGAISVNGIDVNEMDNHSLRSLIGYVPQSPLLFSGTVSENIRYGKRDAADDEIHHAVQVAQASEFVDTLQNGYGSIIAQGGRNLSGGQKQRLSIARALVRKPEIYIFDDSFSALDFKTDAALRAALADETGDSAVIIVAQRVSTVMDADMIIVMDEGHIAGSGTHDELIKSCNVYREIVFSQLSEEELAK